MPDYVPTDKSYELQSLSVTHNAIADWLISNPGKGQMKRCAVVFDITPSWLSTLIHQDAFRALLKIKQGEAFEEVVIPLRDKMTGLAHRSVERMGEIIEDTKDHRLVKDISKDMMTGLGLTPSLKAPGVLVDNSTHNHLTVDAAALAKARENQSKFYGRTLENSSESEDSPSPDQTKELPVDLEAEMGEARDVRAEHVNSSKELPRLEAKGG